MADIDKNMIMGMLQNLLGDSEQKSTDSSGSGLENQSVSLPVTPGAKDADDFLNTAAMMSRFADIMGKFQTAGNSREAALLSALRPYLRSSRQPKVDTMLRVLQAFRVFSEMKKGNS